MPGTLQDSRSGTSLLVPGDAVLQGAGTIQIQGPTHSGPEPPEAEAAMNTYPSSTTLPRAQESTETDALLNSPYFHPLMFLGKYEVLVWKDPPVPRWSCAVTPDLSFWGLVSRHLEGDAGREL